MFSKVFSGAVVGIEGKVIQVEVDISDGLPIFEMVGYLGSQVREAKERVRISLKNSGYKLPPKRTTINLSPADLRKEGTAFDLPIAVAILVTLGIISETKIQKTLIIGELSLNGKVNKVNGVLPVVYAALQKGFTRCIVPSENAGEGAVIYGVKVIGVQTLLETVEYLKGNVYLEAGYLDEEELFSREDEGHSLDFLDVAGQKGAKRGVTVAAAGFHNLLMIGPPGSGKSMIARRIPGILPSLTLEESIEISKVYSVMGMLNREQAIVRSRPFRTPHHTITTAALAGGGRNARPGEISMASGGVLFLDELPEFNKNTLETLRQPLEDREVIITRLNASCHYPANFMLVAAMNPCNCGYYPDRDHCRCESSQIKHYLGKISSPLLERIDICVETIKIDYKELDTNNREECSSIIKDRVAEARQIQLRRYKNDRIHFNSELTPDMIKQYCPLKKKEKELLEQAFVNLHLSARAYHRILKTARTIADLDHKEDIDIGHLSEAICYRGMDKKYWGED